MASIDQPRQVSAAPDLRRTAALAVGDALAFMLFAAIGRASHGEASGLSAVLQIAETAAPFMVGWFVIAPFVGAYAPAISRQPRSMVGRTALAWLIAWPIGLVLRAVIRSTSIAPTFAVITLVTVLIILLGWRGAFAWLSTRSRRVSA
jgi:Protein of unknown function (DUF3054)